MTSLSWIPSEAIVGGTKLVFDAGVTHYDEPPPDEIHDLAALRDTDRFRFANALRAWIEVDPGGRVTRCGYSGGGEMGRTTVRLGRFQRSFQAVKLPDLQLEPQAGDGWMRFVQTAGGRTGVPAPRRVRRKPFVQWQAPLVWTTLSLTLHANGTSDFKLHGASRFPRHWVYDHEGTLAQKSGLADFRDWYAVSFGLHTPWGQQDSEVLVTAVETALERALAAQLMRGASMPRIIRASPGDVLVRQGDAGDELFLLLDGVLRIERDGERLAEYGPGAMLGERSHLEGTGRTASLVAVTPCRVAAVRADQFDRSALVELSQNHRREDTGQD